MSEQTFLRINHGGKSQTIALFPDLAQEELQSLLNAIFDISGRVLGFVSDVSIVFYNPHLVGLLICLYCY
jgi:hypothetical protein